MRGRYVSSGLVFFSSIVLIIAFSISSYTISAAPPMMSVKQRKAFAEIRPVIKQGMTLQQIQQGAIFAGPVIESTGFEVEDGWVARDENNSGFICGPTVEDCSAPVSGDCPDPGGNCCIDDPNPDNGWYTSISSLHCREPHIDTVNPATGQQHLRFQRDDLIGCTGFTNECRQTAFTPAPLGHGQLPIGNDVMSVDISRPNRGNSSFIVWWINDAAVVPTVAFILFDYYSDIFALDNLYGYRSAGSWVAGEYKTLRIEVRNCDDIINYFYGGQLVLSHQMGTSLGGNSAGINRAILMTDNASEVWDVDNYSITRGAPCPELCDQGGVEPFYGCGAENVCVGGSNDEQLCGNDSDCPDGLCRTRNLCRGQCVALDSSYLCTCLQDCWDPCECDLEDLPNGTTERIAQIAEITYGGWFTFVADSRATAIDTCGAIGYDSNLVVYTNSNGKNDCASEIVLDTIVASNNNCNINDPIHGQGTDPLASCQSINGEEQSNACLCFPTNVGQRYWIWDMGGHNAIQETIRITKSNRLTCNAIWENGACCRGATGVCEDDVSQANCMGIVDIYTHNKLCETLQVCEAVPGVCCDSAPGLGGACEEDVLFADCQGQFLAWSGNVTCRDVTCVEVTGACCDPLDGFCSVTLKGDCTAHHPNGPVWTIDTNCNQVSCDPALGACCNTRLGTCTENVILADCTGQNLNWTKQDSCNTLTCPDPFIPTVSQWGLVLMTLLLLIGAKIYYGHASTFRTEK